MNERLYQLMRQAQSVAYAKASEKKKTNSPQNNTVWNEFPEVFAELIVAECTEQVEQAKNSPFVSLDDAKRMSHFVDVTKKRIEKHFRS